MTMTRMMVLMVAAVGLLAGGCMEMNDLHAHDGGVSQSDMPQIKDGPIFPPDRKIVDGSTPPEADMLKPDAKPDQFVWLDKGCIKTNGGVEQCDGKDNDCNGQKDDVAAAKLATDVKNCGQCGKVCPSATQAKPACVSAKCGITCNTGYVNVNGKVSDGCECFKQATYEICGNGKDDNCDGKKDVKPCWIPQVKYDFTKRPLGMPLVIPNTISPKKYDGWAFDPIKFGQKGPTGASDALAFNKGWIQVGASQGNFDGMTARYEFDLYLEKLAKDVGATNQSVLGTGYGCVSLRAWSFTETNGILTINYSKNGTDQHYLYLTKKVVSGVWYQVEIVFQGGKITLTVNSKSISSAGNIFQTSNPLTISKNTCSTQPRLMGKVANLKILSLK